ncbi:DUF3870 domain-containing protein [Siminovitchia sp. 179-K 8D1 HS]|uniref:DUF3870 domain-containing protein n=1 Tax=Siminovitchia sp. 179-K 8D1 HS TaxID=3142385 RepID=UPI0039A1CCBA
MKKDHVLVAGFAQFPKGTPVYETQKVIGCILIIDKTTDIIVDASFTFILDMTNEFISSLVRGKCIKNGVEAIIKELEEKFLIPGQRAVIQSVIAAYERYHDMK